MEVREAVLEAAIKAFNQKGLKFTMDDIAKELSMSKKTIYTIFNIPYVIQISICSHWGTTSI